MERAATAATRQRHFRALKKKSINSGEPGHVRERSGIVGGDAAQSIDWQGCGLGPAAKTGEAQRLRSTWTVWRKHGRDQYCIQSGLVSGANGGWRVGAAGLQGELTLPFQGAPAHSFRPMDSICAGFESELRVRRDQETHPSPRASLSEVACGGVSIGRPEMAINHTGFWWERGDH